MPDRRNREKKDNRRSSEDIQVPPISKQTAGAVTGAAIGSVAGPLGAVVGGVVGAIAGKVAVGRRPVRKGIKRVTGVSKRGGVARSPGKKSRPESRKTGPRPRGKTEKRKSMPSAKASSRKRTGRASRSAPQAP